MINFYGTRLKNFFQTKLTVSKIISFLTNIQAPPPLQLNKSNLQLNYNSSDILTANCVQLYNVQLSRSYRV